MLPTVGRAFNFTFMLHDVYFTKETGGTFPYLPSETQKHPGKGIQHSVWSNLSVFKLDP